MNGQREMIQTSVALSSRDRELYAAIADVLIPSYGSRPSASNAEVPTRWVDEALEIRPDLLAPLREVVAVLQDEGVPEGTDAMFKRLQELPDELIAAVGTLTAGAYFLNPDVREEIGYPGQEARTYSIGTDLPYLDLLERVVERGETFQPTIDSDPNTHPSGELMSPTPAPFTSKKSISMWLALQSIEAAVEEAQDAAGAFSVVVLDESGHVTASARMDGAALSSLQVATDKAYTVIATGFTPTQWYEYAAGDPKMASGVRGMERVVTFDGGLPIVASGEVIGAVGVSGGHYEQDLRVATAAAQAAARLLGEESA